MKLVGHLLVMVALITHVSQCPLVCSTVKLLVLSLVNYKLFVKRSGDLSVGKLSACLRRKEPVEKKN